jgi:hypothetical protein
LEILLVQLRKLKFFEDVLNYWQHIKVIHIEELPQSNCQTHQFENQVEQLTTKNSS